MNLNILFGSVILIEGVVMLILLLRFIFRKFRTKEHFLKSTIHSVGIFSVFFFLGHLTSITTLYLANYQTIQIFKKYKKTVPVTDRINGDWILDDKRFLITDEEREALEENYASSSPCYYDQGYCYFELGGFLKNSGGYCIRIDDNERREIGSFGFHRINKITRLIGNWMYYE